MKDNKKHIKSEKPQSTKRSHRVTITFNDDEFKLVERYSKKYCLKSVSGTMRETIILAFLKQLDEDRPTLFD